MNKITPESDPFVDARPAPRGAAGLQPTAVASAAPVVSDPGPRRITRRDLVIATLCALVFVVFVLAEFWNYWGKDFSAYYYAGKFFHAGDLSQIYAGPPKVIGPEMPESWRAAVRADGFETAQTFPFLYLPWMAWAMAPVAAHVSPLAAMNVALVLNIALSMLSVFLSWRLFAATTRISFGLWACLSLGVLILSAISIVALSLGQIQILVFTLVLLAFERYRAGKVVLAGVLLAAATMIKVTPAAFAIIFLWDRNWRAVGTFVATALLFLAGSIAVAGWELHRVQFDLMSQLSAQLNITNVGVSLEAFVYQVVDIFRESAPPHPGVEISVPRPGWLDLVVKGVFALGLGVIWAATRRLHVDQRLPEQLIALAILLPLCAPLGWMHYYLLAAYFLPALFASRLPINYILYFGFLAMTTSWLAYWTISIRGTVLTQVVVYVPYFGALLVRVLTHGTAAED